MRFKKAAILIPAVWSVAASIASAALAFAPPFTDNMVLQRGEEVPVFGTAAVGKTVVVTFNGQTRNTTSDVRGKWQVRLDPMGANAAGGNLTATELGANTATLTNVVVGDVWLCGGQSNMDMILASCDRQVDIDTANFPVMRQFRAPLVQSGTPESQVSGSWTVCSPATAGNFSAVAFYFGRKICQDQNSAIPIGLYVASVGGTTIDPWLAPEGATDLPDLAPLYDQPVLPSGPFRLFNGMVHPYAPLPAKGMIWYQGENAESGKQSADSYYLKMKALAQGYKRLLGVDDFAFYFVQLAYWGQQQTSPEPVLFSGGWDADTRIQQARAMALPHSGMASAMDVGSSLDGDRIWDGWHPKNKYDVGVRLALWALKNDYGRPIATTSGPMLRDVTISGGTLVCSFDHIGEKLMVGSKEWYHPTQEEVGGTLEMFSIAGASGPWYEATATIVGDTVVVSSPSVPLPRKVAYACSQNPVGANLYNKVTLGGVADGLPASPFHVDDVTARFTVTASAGPGGSISPAGASTYLKRATALYTITPDPGKFIQDVRIDDVSVGSPRFFTFDPLYANRTITATFGDVRPDFTVSATATGGGDLSPGGEVGVEQGGTRTFTVEPGPGAKVALSVDGKPLGARTRHTFADVRENHTISASFTFPITAQAGYGGSISPAGTTDVAHGGNATYTITPQPGFAISKVTVDGTSVGAPGSHTFSNVTASHSITATFTGTGGSGSVPRTDKLYCSFLTDQLPDSGVVNSWASYLPSGKTLTKMNTPTVETIDGRKFVSNSAAEGDAMDLGTVASPIPASGATLVVVAKPSRFGSDPGWTSLVDVFYDRLVLGILNGSGKVVVRRNGSLETSATGIPDGQTTILSLVVQPNGTYKVFANGNEFMNVSSTSDMTSLVPGVAGGFANHITFGRNWPDGWSTYNGHYGDSFLYTVALDDADRQQLEMFLVNRLTSSGPSHTIDASAGEGGSITPSGAVTVPDGGNQSFAIAPQQGYGIADVLVDGASVGAVPSYEFTGVSAGHAIAAVFAATGNTAPTISGVDDQTTGIDAPTGMLAFTVSDIQTPAGGLTVTAESSNAALVPRENISLGGSGTTRTVQITPVGGESGSTIITLTVSDGELSASTDFLVTVRAPSAAGGSISINVGLNGDLPAGDLVGVVASGNWNDLTASGNPSAAALLDDQGNPVGGFNVAFQGNGNTFNRNDDPNIRMLSGFLSGGTMTASLSGIPYPAYDVYIYYSGFSSGQTLTWTATDTDSSDVLRTWHAVRGTKSAADIHRDSGFVASQYDALGEAGAATSGEGGNYLKFSGLTAGNLTLAETSRNGFGEIGFAGIQIVEVSPIAGGGTFAEWIAGYPGVGDQTGFSHDPDGDGLVNGIECHFGTNPSQPDGGLASVARSGADFRFRHPQGKIPAGDIEITYQWSTDLVNWFYSEEVGPDGSIVVIGHSLVPDPDSSENELVEVIAVATAGGPEHLFARIRAAIVP